MLLIWLAALVAEPLLRLNGRARAGHLLAQGADLLLFVSVLASTGTRGGFLGLMLGLGALLAGWLWMRRQGLPWRRRLKLAGLGLAGLLVGLGALTAALGPSFRTRMVASLSNPGQAYENSRKEIWGPAVQIWRDHFWAGTGVDTFKTIFPAYSNPRFNAHDGENVSSRMAHCEPLQILATQGLIGLLLWCWLCLALFAAATARPWRRNNGSGPGPWLGLGALGVAYLGQNLVSFGVAADHRAVLGRDGPAGRGLARSREADLRPRQPGAGRGPGPGWTAGPGRALAGRPNPAGRPRLRLRQPGPGRPHQPGPGRL